MPWVEVFAVLLVSHLAGDYLLQTGWQASNKAGGLGRDPIRRRALFSHVATYGLAFVPALVWLAGDLEDWVVAATAAAIVVPHLVQDDGRLLNLYISVVKRSEGSPGDFVYIAVDQSFHVIVLFALAVIVGE